MITPLVGLHRLDQSVWLDVISRQLIDSGRIAALIDAGELAGITSNPTIFEKAIVGSDDYDGDIRALAGEGLDAAAIYRALTVADIRRAADLLRPVHEKSDGRDGFVSLEVSPRLAHDTDNTISEAQDLWKAVDRPNLLIKVPGTREGLPAIRRLIADGINVNVTLLFGLARYREVADAFIAGLDDRHGRGEPVNSIASVASFFLSRIDVLVDPKLEALAGSDGNAAAMARSLRGEIAIASAKAAYQIYRHEVITDERFRRAAAEGGARPQRLLWASTGTKNPAYSDVKYVEPLIGPATVNTMPLATMDAYRDHGDPACRLEEDIDSAHRSLRCLEDLGLELDALTQQLEDEGVKKFIEPYEATMRVLERACEGRLASHG